MPVAHGSDHITAIGDAYLISTKRDKGWTPRHTRTATNPEVPGTAVDWDGAMYEVVARNESGDQVRYRLENWKPSQAIRQLEHYDEASELQREQQWEADRHRDRIARRLELFGVFTGHLPAEAQHHLNALYGVSVTRITMLSTLPLMLFAIYCVQFISIASLPSSPPPFPKWVIPIGFYFFLESVVRLRSWLRGNPMGSAIGWVVFVIWWILGGRKTLLRLEADALSNAVGPQRTTGRNLRPESAVPPAARDEAGQLPLIDADIERKLRDQYVMREVYIALLSVEEQEKVQRRFGFDPIRQGKISAAALLACTGIGAIITIVALLTGEVRATRLLAALTTIGLIVEQIHRLTLLSAGKVAPSILAPLVRPFLRKVVDAPPPQPLFEGENKNAPMPDVWDG